MKLLARIPPGILLLNQQIFNSRYGTVDQQDGDEALHPHRFIVCRPRGPIRAIFVLLHGGGGNVFQYLATLGILTGFPVTPSVIRWPLLESLGCAVIAVQAMAPMGVNPLWGAGNNPWNPRDVDTRSDPTDPDDPGVPLWAGGPFDSGYDDPQMCRDMAPYVVDEFGAGKLRILAGHSAGGILVDRMWCYHQPSAGYTNYCSTSGSTFIDYSAVTPAVPRPRHASFGAQDTNLGIAGGHFADATYTLLGNVTRAWSTWPDRPQIIGGLQSMQARVNAYNDDNSLPGETIAEGDGVTTAVATGFVKEWSGSGGANILRLYSAADHSNTVQQRCDGQLQLKRWLLWALANH